MSEPPLVPSPVYGLRTWQLDGDERLTGTQHATVWPAGGAWLTATCAVAPEHAPPVPGCRCGAHALHPTPAAARRVLAVRGVVPGVAAGAGAVELDVDGFRAERARPVALMAAPGRNARQLARVAAAYGAELVPVRGADDVLAWCRARGLGLEPAEVAELIGPETVARRERELRERRRTTALRLGAVALLVAALLGAGLLVTADPGGRPLTGRTGEIRGGAR